MGKINVKTTAKLGHKLAKNSTLIGVLVVVLIGCLINAIYVTAGGPSGAAQALKDAGMDGKVTLVCHDVLDAVADYIADGTISVAIDQDPFNQGYQPVVCAFNKLVADQDCDEINTYDAVIATPDTVKDQFPELFE